MPEERIQKILATAGVCSRRAAELLIKAGRVRVNGRPVGLGDKADPAHDIISVDGENVHVPKKRRNIYIMLNKPRGYVTTAKDAHARRTVMDLVVDIPERLYPAGRLDKDSEGLLILTNDGDFTNRLLHPSSGVTKLYRVTVRPRASEDALAKLAAGVTLDDGAKTAPASVRVVTADAERSVLEISITEGKNRQIRRMCEAVGLSVARLRRNSVGPLKLGMLKPGTWRELTTAEVAALMRAASKE